jgi:TolB-like protein/tetratricopeptide (TPR) repeat protein
VTIQQFVEELQRRHVFRVAGGYLVASWISIEVSNTVFGILGWPAEWSKLVLYAALAGLPVALVLSWMFDFTKAGIVRTPKWVPPENRFDDSAHGIDGIVSGSPAPAKSGVILSTRATGMFGLGAIVAIASLAAYTTSHAPTDVETKITADSTTLVNIKAIAVMPFEDISQKQDQEYFADGMTEELLSRLAQVEGLQIVSGEGYASPTRGGDLQTVAKRLKVDAILQGSVRKSQDSIRVSVKLMNPGSNQVLYVQSFTRPMSNIFQVQDEIAAAVASSLQVQMNTGVAQATGTRGTPSNDAYEFYLQGMKALDERTDTQLRLALDFFNDAIKLDPRYAEAYAGLAQTYAVLPTVGSFSFEEAGRKGNAAAASAIGLNPNLGPAHAALGQIAQNLGWNPLMAENSYKRAIEFQPNYATGHQWYAEALTMLGRTDEALAEITKALQLEPYSPAAKNTLGYLLTVRGQLDSALVVFRNEGALYPNYKLGHLTHVLTALAAKRYDEAEASAQTYAAGDTKLADAMVTVIRGAAGKAPKRDAQRAAASLEAKMGACFTALWYGALDDRANALKMVSKAYNSGNDANFPYFVIHPLLAPLHAEPEYQKIVASMGVVPAR